MRILYDFGFYHEMPFYKEKQKQFNEHLKEIIKYLYDMTLVDLKPPTEKIDKIFLEGMPENKKYSVKSLKKDGTWAPSIKKLNEKYESDLVGLEKPSYYTMAFLAGFVTYAGTYNKNKILSKIFKKIDKTFNRARTYHFANVINKELKDDEVGIALHGRAHEITGYLNKIAPDIKVYSVENKLADILIEHTIKSMKFFLKN